MAKPPQENDRASEPDNLARGFIDDLSHWRKAHGVSQKKLAAQMGYDASYVNKIERGQQRPTREFAKLADQVLQTGGALTRRQREYEAAQSSKGVDAKLETKEPALETPRFLVCHEDAGLVFKNGMYHIKMRRQLRNTGSTPVTRYLVRVSVDRHPDNPQLSNELYRHNPLTWDELQLQATCEGEQMHYKIKQDRDAVKEAWLLFENEHGKFPLYEGQTVWIEYQYSVSADKWGKWFQRSIRMPTQKLGVQLSFPAELDAVVWGLETSMTAEAVPVRTSIAQTDEAEMRTFSWSANNPDLDARIRFEWRFRAEKEVNIMDDPPSERMSRIGVRQQGDPILEKSCKPFDLPDEAEIARSLGDELVRFLEPIGAAHTFGKGMGLATPQIGKNRSVAVVRLPGDNPLILFNPQIIDQSEETDEQYEGCLSLFDVRGKVERPLRIDVEHMTLDGELRIITFERAAARLWAHEIDHLQGMLYVDRMAPNVQPISAEVYRSAGQSWSY